MTSTEPTTSPTGTPETAAGPSGATRAYPIFVGLTSLAIIVQGVLAGVFVQSLNNGNDYSSWVTAHKVGGNVTLAFGVITAALAIAAFRHRKEILYGSIALAVLLGVEFTLGQSIIGSKHQTRHVALTIIHIPLALLLFGVTVFLAVRAAAMRRENSSR